MLKVASNSKQLDVLERLYICKAAKCKQILNKQYIGESNVLFDLVIDNDKRRRKITMNVGTPEYHHAV
jgi:hypothetical protein